MMKIDQPNKLPGQKFFVKSTGQLKKSEQSDFNSKKKIEKSPTEANSSCESTVFSQSRRFLPKSNKALNGSTLQSFFQKQEIIQSEWQQTNRQKFFNEVIDGQAIEQNKRNVKSQLKRTLRIKSQAKLQKQYQPFIEFQKSVNGRENTYMNFMVPSAQRTSQTQFANFPSTTKSNSIPLIDLWSQKQMFQLQFNEKFTKEQYCVQRYIQQKKQSETRTSKENFKQTEFLNQILDKIYQKQLNQKKLSCHRPVKSMTFGLLLKDIEILNSDSAKLHQEFSKLKTNFQIINNQTNKKNS